MLRRAFLAALAGTAALPGWANNPKIRLGIDAYSIRAYGWKAPRLLEYSIEQKLDVLQFSGLHEFESLEPAYLSELSARAKSAGVGLEVGIGSICPTARGFNPKNGTALEYLQRAVTTAKHLGAPLVKAYVGASVDRLGPEPIERHIEETLKVLRTARPMAVDAGVKVAMENHSGDLLARELTSLIETAGKDWVGCCLDTGNPMLTAEDPQVVLEILGPHTITTHVRDSILFEHPKGAAWQWVAMGDGVVDWGRFMTTFREVCPNAAILMENITGRPPRVIPFLERDFWNAFRNHRASDFAAFVQLAKRGHPLMESMIIADAPGEVPNAYRDALKEQQKRDLEKGFAFARKQMGAGV